MPLHDAPCVRESDARTFELLVRMQPLEHAEQSVGQRRIESDAVIRHTEDHFLVLSHTCDPDARVLARTCVLDRIRDQIRPHLPQQPYIALHRGQRGDLPLDPAIPQIGLHLADDLFDQHVIVDA